MAITEAKGGKEFSYPAKYYEPTPEPFEGEYRNLISALMSNTWIGILYVVASIIILYTLGHVSNPLYLFFAIEIPTITACSYVVSPNPNIAFRLPINWIGTAVLVALMFAAQLEPNTSEQKNIGNAIGITIWCFVAYWAVNAILWNIRAWGKSKDKLNQIGLINLVAYFLAIWGATIQVAYMLSWIFLPFIRSISYNAPIPNSLISAIDIVRNYSVLRFLPIGILILGILLMASLRFKEDPYYPRALHEVLPSSNGNQILNSFIMGIRIPVWIVVVIMGFISHFSMLIWKSVTEFLRTYFARLICVAIGLILGPTLLFIGHKIGLFALDNLAKYLNFSASTYRGIINFFYVNFLMLAALCLYVIAAPPLLVRYRGETANSIISSIQIEIYARGKVVASAIGQTFSLFGIIAFVVPVASLLPGGHGFGVFSILYSIIVAVSLIIYLLQKKK